MRKGKRLEGRFAAGLLALALLASPGFSAAMEKEHGSMSGAGHGGAAEGHMKMGDRIWGGKVGPWQGEARLMDMKAHMEKAKASGMKMEGMMKSHHVSLHLTDAKTNKELTEAKGTVAVVGPDGKEEKAGFMFMEGHLGADVNLPKPGKYTFKVDVESGGRKGAATFAHTVK